VWEKPFRFFIWENENNLLNMITNGMALCKLRHWSFDKGLMSVGKDYEVLISGSTRTDKNILGHTLTLMDRPIFMPRKEKYRPDPEKLAWHRKEKFIDG
jgi:putative restriction endonuclease